MPQLEILNIFNGLAFKRCYTILMCRICAVMKNVWKGRKMFVPAGIFSSLANAQH